MRISFFLLPLTVTALHSDNSKLDLICHTWRLVGIKSHNGKYNPVHTPEDEILTYEKDGTYEKVLYGQLKIGGKWEFADDSTKLVFSMTSMNGTSMPPAPHANVPPSDSLIRLTADTLIDARIAWFGPQQEYGHDDWYYIRANEK